jgi:subtilisin family serine protease
MNRYLSFFRTRALASFFVLSVLAGLAGCANSGEKTFLPVVAKVGAEVKAISAEDAKTVCVSNYCEDNQVYVAHFGRHRHEDPAPPAPQPVKEPSGTSPTVPPYGTPPQPGESLDYSRSILNVQPAWNITEGSPTVVVAVIDSGVDYFHPDLAANIVDPGYDFYHDRVGGYDDNGHGTHCSGIIAAAKNGIGVRGIAPKVKILPVKFLGPDGSGDTADAVKAIDYAVARGAKILSNSWGGGGYSQLLDDAIQRALNAGVIFVAAAGNDGLDTDGSPNYPANYAGVISVGSSDSRDQRSSFSNYGTASVEVFAPGTSIVSTYPGGTYKSLSGTSMATPQVSGALALALSAKPGITAAAATTALCDSAADKLTSVSKCGRMDVGAFIERVSGR